MQEVVLEGEEIVVVGDLGAQFWEEVVGDDGEIDGLAEGCFVKILVHQEEGQGCEVGMGSIGDACCGVEVVFQAVGILQNFCGGVLEESVEFLGEFEEGRHGGIVVMLMACVSEGEVIKGRRLCVGHWAVCLRAFSKSLYVLLPRSRKHKQIASPLYAMWGMWSQTMLFAALPTSHA